MKKLFVLFASLVIVINSFAYHIRDIDDHLLRTFASNFPNAQKVVWQELQEAYVVSFVEDRIRIRITYLRNGELTHFIRYYQEENLPLDVRLKIKEKFADKTIYGVVEENIFSNIENRGRTIYHVKLQDNSSWYTVRVEKNKKMKLVEKLNKDI
jgi:hypothetical protein